ncbi:AAA family ATPase [Butyrivibrio sp. NC3005]|uniref:AAA family ATPase n=1 Tax=Butyrivibrio sp. NC3005 TaxID=1280685 RepID=UPI0003FFC2C6|nr:AAA family ATPase [Butyrivibrio sp. NC3005]
MEKTVGLGIQDFEKVIEEKAFYIDKTRFISKWWNSKDDVTLITRPRRFGKTLMLSTVEKFFSIEQDNNERLFEHLEICDDSLMMAECGKWPVLFVSFASIKADNYDSALKQFNIIFNKILSRFENIKSSLTQADLDFYDKVSIDMKPDIASNCLGYFCKWLSDYYGKKTIILIDEYDTPMQEAYVNGYWNKLVDFMRNMFGTSLKSNPNLLKGLLTGITRISRESLFSDMNNLKIISVSSDKYADCFGFTKEEVFFALDSYGYSKEKEKVKKWYDGFKFGSKDEIYNPWSILSFLQEGKYEPYWANTSSNSLISKLVRAGDASIKENFEILLNGGSITKPIDEQLVYGEMQDNEIAVWSLMQATGYLKIVSRTESETGDLYELKLTNYEITKIFKMMVMSWFRGTGSSLYNEFVKSLLAGEVSGMNKFLNKFLLKTCSYFDGGVTASDAEPERFYHRLVLGLMVDLGDRYLLTFNRESGFGRYDVMLQPKDINKDDGIIIEFKVLDIMDQEKTLEDAANSALKQIEDRKYREVLLSLGLPLDKIHCYGFAFSGKTALVKKQ